MSPERDQSVDALVYADIANHYAEYAAALDECRYSDWIDLFLDECSYTLKPRENHDRGLPLATLAFESKGMLRDRIYGIEQTLYHQPYYQRHLIGPLRVRQLDTGWRVETNYCVFRTRRNELSEVFNAGRYIDRVVRVDGVIRIAEKLVVFDSEMIPNSVIYPI
jgi:salicylate 5-hydroxylase small subunit